VSCGADRYLSRPVSRLQAGVPLFRIAAPPESGGVGGHLLKFPQRQGFAALSTLTAIAGGAKALRACEIAPLSAV
jgi:hypothetical protein